MKSPSYFRVVLPLLYCVAFIGTLVYWWIHRHESPLAGVLAILVTCPWSMVLFKLIPQGAISSDPSRQGMLIIGIALFLNAGLLYGIGSICDFLFSGKVMPDPSHDSAES